MTSQEPAVPCNCTDLAHQLPLIKPHGPPPMLAWYAVLPVTLPALLNAARAAGMQGLDCRVISLASHLLILKVHCFASRSLSLCPAHPTLRFHAWPAACLHPHHSSRAQLLWPCDAARHATPRQQILAVCRQDQRVRRLGGCPIFSLSNWLIVGLLRWVPYER